MSTRLDCRLPGVPSRQGPRLRLNRLVIACHDDAINSIREVKSHSSSVGRESTTDVGFAHGGGFGEPNWRGDHKRLGHGRGTFGEANDRRSVE